MPDLDSARERTRLAWRRTVLAATVVVILGVRLAVVRTTPGFAAFVTSVSAAAWLAFLALTQRRIRQLTQGHDQAPNRSVPLIVQLILVYEVVGAFLVLRSR
jgi:uncharacterized membrane protein YidH (DUF202 family)